MQISLLQFFKTFHKYLANAFLGLFILLRTEIFWSKKVQKMALMK